MLLRSETVLLFVEATPLFNSLNKNCSKYNKNNQEFSIGESMVQYFGFHSNKHFIKGKPNRYWYKIWTCPTSNGMPAWFEPYCGTNTLIIDQGLGQGPIVVLELVEKAGLRLGMRVTYDNLFTSIAVISRLIELGIGGTGTNTIPDKKEAERTMKRGEYKCMFKDDMAICCWRDD